MVNNAETTDEELVDEITTDTTSEEKDYESLYNELLEESKKDKENFKKMAKRYNDLKAKDPEVPNLDEILDKKLSESEFYSSDPVAKEFKKEIKEIQSKYDGMSPDEAFKLWKNDGLYQRWNGS